jgi:hypothetical protein
VLLLPLAALPDAYRADWAWLMIEPELERVRTSCVRGETSSLSAAAEADTIEPCRLPVAERRLSARFSSWLRRRMASPMVDEVLDRSVAVASSCEMLPLWVPARESESGTGCAMATLLSARERTIGDGGSPAGVWMRLKVECSSWSVCESDDATDEVARAR